MVAEIEDQDTQDTKVSRRGMFEFLSAALADGPGLADLKMIAAVELKIVDSKNFPDRSHLRRRGNLKPHDLRERTGILLRMSGSTTSVATAA